MTPKSPREKKATGYIVVTLAFHREGSVWVGVCKELSSSTYGRTLEQANSELLELVILHLNALETEGEREHFFEKHGIKVYPDKPIEVCVEQQFAVDGTYYQPHAFPIGGEQPPAPGSPTQEPAFSLV